MRKKDPLTVEKLRTYPGCEHYTDEQAEEIVSSIEILAEICLEYVLNEEKNQNSKVISKN